MGTAQCDPEEQEHEQTEQRREWGTPTHEYFTPPTYHARKCAGRQNRLLTPHHMVSSSAPLCLAL